MMKNLELRFKLIQGWDVEENNDFESWLNGITEGDDSSEEEELEPEVEEEVEEEAEVEAPVEDEPEVETPPEPDLEQPVDQKPVAKQAPVGEETPVAKPQAKTPEQEKAEVEAFMGELQKQYALTDDDADAILTDPKTVLPRLMANAHAMILQQVGHFIQQAMPTIVQSQVRNVSTTDQRLAEFQTMYPELATPENQAIAMVAIQTVKQANPGIAYKEMLKKVGPVAEALLGKPVSKKQGPKAEAKPRPHIPAKTSTSTAQPKEKSSDPTVAFFESLQKF